MDKVVWDELLLVALNKAADLPFLPCLILLGILEQYGFKSIYDEQRKIHNT